MFNILAFALLLLFVAMLLATRDHAPYRDLFSLGHGMLYCDLYNGRWLRFAHHVGGPEALINSYSHQFRIPYFATLIHFGGGAVGYRPYDDYWLVLDLYHLLPVVAALLVVMAFLWHRRKRFVPEAGFCRSCGYDLRATPDRCPECGTVPNKTI